MEQMKNQMQSPLEKNENNASNTPVSRKSNSPSKVEESNYGAEKNVSEEDVDNQTDNAQTTDYYQKWKELIESNSDHEKRTDENLSHHDKRLNEIQQNHELQFNAQTKIIEDLQNLVKNHQNQNLEKDHQLNEKNQIIDKLQNQKLQ